MRALFLALLLTLACSAEPTICGVKPGMPLEEVLRQHPHLLKVWALSMRSCHRPDRFDTYTEAVSSLMIGATNGTVTLVSGRALDIRGETIVTGDSLKTPLALGAQQAGDRCVLQSNGIEVTIYHNESAVTRVMLSKAP